IHPHLLVLSARSQAALLRLATAHADHLDVGGAGREESLRDVCATAATRRDAHPFRLWVVGEAHDDFVRKLRALASGEHIPDGGLGDAGVAGPRRTVFVFPGQGGQWLGMGRGLYASSPAFRAALDACDRAVGAELGWSVVELLHADADAFPAGVERVQPALWAVEVALAAAWRELGVEPRLCVGHSMGEVAAAHVSGALTPADAASVICRRSRLMKRTAGRGAMLATELSAAEARHLIERHGDRVCVAAENAPASTVLAGYEDTLTGIEEELRARGVFCRRVKVNVASHSPLMDELRDDLTAELAHLAPADATTRLISTVRGTAVDGPELTASYWADNLRSPVRFTGTVAEIAQERESVFVEISPHPVLLAALQETLAAPEHEAGAAVASLCRDADEPRELVRAAGRFWAVGGDVDWGCWYPGPVRTVPLPHYPWDLTEFRHRPLPETHHASAAVTAPTLQVDVPLSRLGLHEWGEGVRLHGIAPVPPAVHLATLLTTARDALPGGMFRLAEVTLGTEPLDLTDSHDVLLRTLVSGPDSHGVRRATVEAHRPGSRDGILCASAELRESDSSEAVDGSASIDTALGRCRQYLSAAAFDALATRQGYEIGEAFRAVDQLWRREGEAVARMRRPKAPSPAAWETGLQPLLAAWPTEQGAYVPVGFAGVELYADLTEDFWSVCTFRAGGAPGSAVAEAVLLGPDGRPLARFTGIRLRRLRTGGRPPLAPAVSALPAVVRTAGRNAGRGAQALVTRVRAAAAAFGTPTTLRPAARPEARRAPSPPTTTLPTTTLPTTTPATPTPPTTTPATPTQTTTDTGPDAVRILAATVLGMPAEHLDGRRPLRDYGLDSLMAAQLQVRLRRECGIEITVGRLLGDESLSAIGRGSVSFTHLRAPRDAH
ncbi:acyltransferase domain-containing protein, partial [Streptomyces sp. MZ04]|uniref:acyltransferase domain-containing protein n=1 Tax=Streptomyces sp. MZ04 TaxID=2559236 RepID=UPI00107EBBDB